MFVITVSQTYSQGYILIYLISVSLSFSWSQVRHPSKQDCSPAKTSPFIFTVLYSTTKIRISDYLRNPEQSSGKQTGSYNIKINFSIILLAYLQLIIIGNTVSNLRIPSKMFLFLYILLINCLVIFSMEFLYKKIYDKIPLFNHHKKFCHRIFIV